ncbi:DUF7144 family membrane protein [Pseudonocardia sichuanensis]
MSTSQSPSAGYTPVAPRGRWMAGFALFAGVIMLALGVYHALAGIAAIVGDEIYVTAPEDVYTFDLTSWGWIHLVLGVLVALAGGAVLSGRLWGRLVGIVVAALSMIANFVFIPYYPIWSLVMIPLCVAVIWALAVYDPA